VQTENIVSKSQHNLTHKTISHLHSC